MRSGTEIQRALRQFVDKWRTYAGSEIQGAQTFLNELVACYGQSFDELGAAFEVFLGPTRRLDLHWPGVLIVEMKAPGKGLINARQQALDYWSASEDAAAGIPKAQYVVLCDFRELQVWEPGRFEQSPRASFAVADLVDHYDALAFLAGPHITPVFAEHRRDLTTAAVSKVAEVFASLSDRPGVQPEEVRRFLTQSVWCMFAEDLGMLEGYPFQRTLGRLLDTPGASPAAELGYLFRLLNKVSGHTSEGPFAGTQYVNGELFAEPAELDLSREELLLLREASEFDWRQVDPTIFGSLLEGVLGHERRWELGAHYTHEVDIMKIVEPVITRPWRERISAIDSPDAGVVLLDELCAFRVLDPACGCGNFLYVAYRELRSLEAELKARIGSLARERGLPAPDLAGRYYPLRNLQGLDIERTAVQIARVTLWMGHRQMVDRFGPAENPLPLQDLSGIAVADALRVPWPQTDAIIGNPPFLGDRNLRAALGNEYLEWLERTFSTGLKDFCVYWFRKAHDHLKPGQRAGLVGTNSVSQNRARSASLDYVVAHGGVITDAIRTQKWPGDANVSVSIVVWTKQPTPALGSYTLDGAEVPGISSSLRPGLISAWTPVTLEGNRGVAYYGPVPIGRGFILTESEARQFLALSSDSREVVRPFLTGADIVRSPDGGPRRWCIDFGTRTLEEALAFPEPLAHVRTFVKPERDDNNRAAYRRFWWRFGEPCYELRQAISVLPRHIVGLSTGKRLAFVWSAPDVSMNNSTVVFALDSDDAMGVLLSRAHGAWAEIQSSTLQANIRYTPTSVFMTFPWPDPMTGGRRQAIAAASRALLARRSEICLERQIGLTMLYNQVDEGAWADLAALHRALDVAVAEAYGWPASVAQDDAELVRRLTERNREIATGEREYRPFA